MILRDGTHLVRIHRNGKIFDKNNLPYFFNCISNVEAEIGYTISSAIKIVFSPSYNDGLKMLASGLLGVYMGKANQEPETVSNSAGAEVASKAMDSTVTSPLAGGVGEDILDANSSYISLKFLYPGQSDSEGSPLETPWYTGVMFPPTISISGTEISITINAQGSLSILNNIQGVHVYKNQPALTVLKFLASKVGLTIAFDPKDKVTRPALESIKITGAFNEPRMQTLKFILHQADCFWSETAGDDPAKPVATIKVMLRSNVAEQKIIYTFVMFRQIDPSNNIIPIFDFSFGGDTQALFLPGAAFGTFQRYVDEKTNKIVKVKTTSKDAKKIKTMSGSDAGTGALVKSNPQIDGGALGLLDVKDKEDTGASKIVLKTSEASNIGEIKSSANRASQLGPIYNLTVPGLPRLKTTAIVQVIVGDAIPGISSVGQIISVVHISGSEGWLSQISVQQTAGVGVFTDAINKSLDKGKIDPESNEFSSETFG